MLVAESVATYQTFTAVPAQNAKEETCDFNMILINDFSGDAQSQTGGS